VFSWYDIITCEKSTHHRCALSNAFFYNFVIFDVPQYQIDLIILKTYDQQFTLTTKKSLHTIFKLECGQMPNVMAALPNIGGGLCSTPQSLADAHY